MTELKELAKLVRKGLKAAGFVASARISNTSVSECLTVKVTAINSPELCARLLANADDLGGLISADKAFNNATIDAVRAVISEHVAAIDGFRYLSISSVAMTPRPHGGEAVKAVISRG